MNIDETMTAGELTLRKPRVEDAPGLAEAVRSSLPELSPWMPWATEAYDNDAAAQWINGDFGDVYSFVLIEPDGSLVGTCGLNSIDEINRRANLGYWVRSDRAGRGHATAATRLVARYGLTTAGLQRLEVMMSVKNDASRRVAVKSDATYEGVARDRLLLRGEYHDAHMFSFVASDLDPDPYL